MRMLKKAFSTVACMDLACENIIDACLKHNIKGIEIRLGDDGSVCGKTTSEGITEIKKAVADSDLVITDLGSSVCFRDYNADTIEKAKSIVDIAAELETKAVRIFLGYFAAMVNPDKPEPDYDGIVKSIKELCDYADEKKIEIWIETHNEFATGKVLKKLLADVNRANAKIIWDIIHPIEDGEDLEETWEAVGKDIAHIHIKDGFDRKDPLWHDYQYCILGEGALPLYSLFDLLESIDYQGYVSLEWEREWRDELKSLPGDLDFIFEMYNKCIDGYETNKIAAFGSGWCVFDARTGVVENSICVSKHKAYGDLVIPDNESWAKVYQYTTGIKENGSYSISVPYELSGAESRLAAYGLISLSDAEGNVKRRLYLKRDIAGNLNLNLTSENEVSLKLELGLKVPGRVKWYRPALNEIEKIPERKVKIASVHIMPLNGVPYEENLKRVEKAFDNAASKGADILAFGETVGDRGTSLGKYERFETIDGTFCNLMKKKAIQHQCYVFFTFHEVMEDGTRHNTAILLDRRGEIVGVYRKTHLALGEYEGGMSPGNEYPVFDTEFGRIGMLVCWDAYFPEAARAMTFKGAEILFISTAGNPTFRHVARAMENGVYVVVSCVAANGDVGIHPTKIINPCGEILAHTNVDLDCAYAEIDLNKKDYLFWLSVGGSDTVPNGVYMNEYRDDMYKKIK